MKLVQGLTWKNQRYKELVNVLSGYETHKLLNQKFPYSYTERLSHLADVQIREPTLCDKTVLDQMRNKVCKPSDNVIESLSRADSPLQQLTADHRCS